MTTASPAAGISPEFIDQIRAKLARTTVEHYIDGQWTEGARGETFETLDPSTNRVLSRAWRGHAEDIDRAAKAAHAAFQKWGHGKAKDRKKYLLKIASLIEKHGDELAIIECLDAGQALKIVRAQIARTAENFSFYAEYAEKAMDGRTYPVDHEWLNYSLRVPVGPCGIITPWNAPMMLSTWRIAPALATGNTVILKPAEWSPLTAWKLAQIFRGSRSAARRVQRRAGLRRRSGRAAGGSSAGPADHADRRDHHRLHRDESRGRSIEAPVARARRQIARRDFRRRRSRPRSRRHRLPDLQLQWRALHRQFASADRRIDLRRIHSGAWRRALRKVKVGSPLDPDTEVGPLIHPEHRDRVLGYIEIGKKEGAKLLVGGERVGSEGNYVSPALFTGENHMRIAQEEIFGPVLTAIPFKDEADALAKANDVKYGLASYLWTSDVTRAHRMALALEAGMTWINSHNVRHLPTPFGGIKFSGTHREGGEHSFEFYTELKHIAVPLGSHAIPKFGKG